MSPPSHHILVLIKGLDIGGAERMITESSRHWDRSRFDYSVAYALPWADALVPELVGQGIDVHCLGRSRTLTPGVARRLRGVIVDESVDLVHAHLPTMGVIARTVSPVPVVYTEHGIASSYRLTTRIANRATYGRNAAVIAVSQAVADSVGSYPGPEPIVVPNSVEVAVTPEETRGARAELGLGPDDHLVVQVGNIRPGKAHADLVRAAAGLATRDDRAAVVSIGAETRAGDIERLERLAAAEGVADRVRFLGGRADARSFIAAADVYVHPSTVEAFGVAVLEAMALGRPIVATAVGGVAELVSDGETGLLVPPGDPVALAAAIDRLLDDREFAAALGAAARGVAEESHGLAPMVRAIEAVYEDVLRR
ncbi:MAG TPA: glycosyltransferase [Acidimicrobiia bacterium]|nr:glycosyltransferase [Acidimicrobiia bacterium]